MIVWLIDCMVDWRNVMNLKLIRELSERNELDWKIIYAILMCESNTKDNPGSGFWSNGNIKSKFEQVIYDSFIRQKKFYVKNRILPGIDRDWICKHSKEQLKLLATSFGIAQIMGWHYPEIGYSSVEKMVNDYQTSDEEQIISFFEFIKVYRAGRFFKILRNSAGGKNYRKIAKYYNGSGYRKNKYHIKLKTYYDNAPELSANNLIERISKIKHEEIEAMPVYTGENIFEKLKRVLMKKCSSIMRLVCNPAGKRASL